MRALEIAHNDLHCQNILIRRCRPNIVLHYIFQNREFKIPSLGHAPVLIDFGMGRAPPAKDGNLLGSFHFTHYGYYMDEFSPTMDYIRFLCTLRKICKPTYAALSKWCGQILKPIKGIDPQTGWDNFVYWSATEKFSNIVKKAYKHIGLIEDTVWIENLQLLITRPIQRMDGDVAVLEPFFANWKKFEARIGSIHELNFLFKGFVLAVKFWREDFLAEDPTALERIRRDFLKTYEDVVKFFCPEVDFEAMVCSILLGASFLEGFLYNQMEILRARRPARGGPLMWPNCDDALWRSFMEAFGSELAAPADAEVVKCHLECVAPAHAR
jgi:hypothetical protein